ncbi:MAG: LysM peptidoglycan-binding domain-containing protein [Lachnospiraceae bacterium]|nr:LysM peptidoglycan-binding domain-containing protein [Lachnospiraceae bacterium]
MGKKKILALVCSVLALILAACAGNAYQEKNEQKSFSGKTVMEMSAENAAESEAAGLKEEENKSAENEEGKSDSAFRYPLISQALAAGRYSPNAERDILLRDLDNSFFYQIREGDTLWGIAEKYYNNGSAWKMIKDANLNPEEDGNFILAGEEIIIPQNYYIRRQIGSRGGFSSDACSYDVPWNWLCGRPGWEVCLEYSWWPEEKGMGVYTHVTENRLFPNGIGDAWESVQQKIIEIAEEETAVTFTIPVFERYLREDGTELLFYYFICNAGEERIQYAAAYVAGKRFLAEFIGYDILADEKETSEDIIDITRYMAASYTEGEGEKSWDSLKYRPYLGAENWPFEDLHNPFAMAVEVFGSEKPDAEFRGEDREVTFVSKEWERFLKMLTCYHYDLTDEQWEEFRDRPIYLSELAWIQEVELVESPIPGRDIVCVQGLQSDEFDSCLKCNLTTLSDIAVLPNLRKLTLEIGSAADYEVLKECSSLEEISIAGEEQLTELAWISELPQLESLTLSVSSMPHIIEIGYQKEGGSTFSAKTGIGEEEKTADNSDIDVMEPEEAIGKCTALKYLELEYNGEFDFSCLNQLPELYTFILGGEDAGSSEAGQRGSEITDEDYSQIKCLVVDEKWIRNPG